MNKDKCWCDCKKLVSKGVYYKGYAWNPSNCECDCDKTCDAGGYLDYKNCKCRKKLTNKLINDCTKTIEETKLVKITFNENENNYKCGSCIVYIVLMIVAFAISTEITVSLVYYNWSLIDNNYNIHCIKFNNYKNNKNLMSTIL